MIGNRLKLLREESGFSQEELENRLNLSRGYIALMETDIRIPSFAMLEKLAVVLGIPLSRFFLDSDQLPSLPHLPGRCTAEDIVAGETMNGTRVPKRR